MTLGFLSWNSIGRADSNFNSRPCYTKLTNRKGTELFQVYVVRGRSPCYRGFNLNFQQLKTERIRFDI